MSLFMKIIRIILWILGFGMLIAAPIQCSRYFSNPSAHPAEFLIIALPPSILCLCCAAVLTFIRWKNTELKRISHVVCLIICFLVFSIYSFISLALESFHEATTPVTDISQYEKALAKWKRGVPDIVEHFPDTIPADAQDVRFYFTPGFLQGDACILLGFRISEEQFNACKAHFSAITTATFKANHWHKHEYLYHNTETAEWSKDFVVMQFDKDPNTIYEHDNEHGIAINENDNVIVFWAECAS